MLIIDIWRIGRSGGREGYIGNAAGLGAKVAAARSSNAHVTHAALIEIQSGIVAACLSAH